MERPKTTPKDFFLWAGAMVTLYGSIIAFINLLFGYINYAFPDTLKNAYYYYNPYDSGVSYWMAAFIVFGAASIFLMRYIHTTIKKDSTRADIWVRRWALYLTLFVAGVTILGDLIALLNTFLSGQDLTTRFLLKVAVVFLTAGGVFMHFLADLNGYWAAEPKRANAVTIAVALVGVLTIVAGFFIIGTPQQARQYRLDETRVMDLQNIQSQIVTYWQQKNKLPGSLADLRDSLSYFTVPVDPATGEAYEYQPGEGMSFKLCTTFFANSRDIGGKGQIMTRPVEYGVNDNWQHGTGHQCFDRVIDPERYPPITKPIR
jgi:hypothetical protein